jgi:hypothetical protein
MAEFDLIAGGGGGASAMRPRPWVPNFWYPTTSQSWNGESAPSSHGFTPLEIKPGGSISRVAINITRASLVAGRVARIAAFLPNPDNGLPGERVGASVTIGIASTGDKEAAMDRSFPADTNYIWLGLKHFHDAQPQYKMGASGGHGPAGNIGWPSGPSGGLANMQIYSVLWLPASENVTHATDTTPPDFPEAFNLPGGLSINPATNGIKFAVKAA